MLFGTAALDGAQAEYVGRLPGLSLIQRRLMSAEVRVPLADATVMKAPEEIADTALVLMADIFPTGYFAANNAFKDMSREQISDATVVLIGCG